MYIQTKMRYVYMRTSSIKLCALLRGAQAWLAQLLKQMGLQEGAEARQDLGLYHSRKWLHRRQLPCIQVRAGLYLHALSVLSALPMV